MRCSNKECCKQCRYVKFKGTMTKWPLQKLLIGLHKDTPIINNMSHTFDSNVSKHQYFRTIISLFAYCFFL